MSSPLAEAFFLWTILTVVMKHPLSHAKGNFQPAIQKKGDRSLPEIN